MPQLTTQKIFDLALQHHQAGRLQEAEQLYQQILAKDPAHIDAMHLLGVIAHQRGRHGIAVDLIRRTIVLQPNFPEAHNNLGIALKDKGQIDEAIAAYRQAIALNPDYAQAHCNLGNALKDKGQFDEAIAACRRAIALNPNLPQAHINLSIALKERGQIDEAIAAARKAIALNPGFSEAHGAVGNALKDKGQLDEAIAAYRRAIAIRPNYISAHGNLGNALRDKGQFDEAIAAYYRALAFNPNVPEVYCNLGTALISNGQPDDAVAASRQAISLNPNFPEAHNNLGVALKEQGQLDEAITAYQQAIALRPSYAEAHNNLSIALKDKGRLDEAIAVCRHAIALNPNLPQAYDHLGTSLRDQGQIDEAIAAYRRAITLKPSYERSHSNLLFALHYLSAHDSRAIAEEFRHWNHLHAEPLRHFIQPHPNDPNPNRRLKLGYVSADFGEHPVGRFLLPLLERHDHRQFEVFCYSNWPRADAITARFRSSADHWKEISRLNDQQAAKLIRADAIDILVDLSGHTGLNRLLVFAQKPAPVQVSYLGYPGTTGLGTIDYRLTDDLADPVGLTDQFHTEALHRLPHTNWCFAESGDSPPVEPQPATRQGHLTFGSFNNLAKVTGAMLQVWASILRQVSGSRLLLKAAAFGSAGAQERVRQSFAAQGIDVSRLSLYGPQPDHSAHLALYGQMDIALDTFPYHGTTTTCDALWMGVPVITLAGQTHVSRVGLSLLSNIGLPELVAFTPDQYVQIAVELAKDPNRMDALRRGMRARMLASPLMDAAAFARDMEAAYRQMWRNWCETAAAV